MCVDVSGGIIEQENPFIRGNLEAENVRSDQVDIQNIITGLEIYTDWLTETWEIICPCTHTTAKTVQPILMVFLIHLWRVFAVHCMI
jgi:hypothetical protein